MTIDEKVHLNNLAIILGTKCNLRCGHCLGGSPKEQMTINEKYIDELITNINGIDELSFIGYEPTLYIDKMKMVFDKLISKQIRVNRFSIFTNAVMYSQKLVDLIKHYQKYVKSPDKVLLHFSNDSFHYHNHFTKEKCFDNINKYKNAFGDRCKYAIQQFDNESLIIQGRARSLDHTQLNTVNIIEIPTNNQNYKIEFRQKCEHEKNTCNNGKCIYNCIVSELILTPNGYVFIGDYMAFNSIVTNDYQFSIGHISNESLYKMVVNHNSNYKEDHNKTQMFLFKDTYSYTWNVQKALYDYLITIEKILESVKNEDKKEYIILKNSVLKSITNTQVLFNNCKNDNDKEYAIQIYELIIADYSTIISVIDSYYSFPIFKSLLSKQIEMYLYYTPFRKDKFKNTVGIDYALFMKLWNCYYKCDYDNFVSTIESIKK